MVELSPRHPQPPAKTPLAVGLGFFDCVHLGHRKLLAEVIETARRLACAPCVSTFSNNPYRIFSAESKAVYTYAERLTLFEALGVTHVLPFEFDAGLQATGKDAFLDMLFSAFDIRAVVCGHDYKFGRRGEGDAEYLKRYAESRGAEVTIVGPVLADGIRVSSTLIKEYLEKGELERANRLLGGPFFACGTVGGGCGRGRLYGFPTANLMTDGDKLLPCDGVYATQTAVDGKLYRSVTHIGAKPTFADAARSVETLLDGFSGDLYGKEIKVGFLSRLRGIEKFPSPQALREQICKDLLMR